MRHRILVLPAAGLMAASFTANAQTETLDYQGSLLSSGETISGSVVLGVPLGADVANATVIPASFQFPTLFIDSPAPGYYGSYVGTSSFTFTTHDGAIVGWNISFSLETPGSTNSPGTEDAVISNGGDSYLRQTYGVICTVTPDNPNPCPPQSASNAAAGSWTVVRAPEIDPASAAGGLTLLLGGAAVLRGRRKLRS